jgi:hypothetical protein
MNHIVFVPGLSTSQTCSSIGDTYFDIYTYALENHYKFWYIPLHNNNYGDIGNITVDDCLETVIHRYNELCSSIGTDDTILLAGHSMGGLLISKMMTDMHHMKLTRLPNLVRLLNTAFRIRTSWMNAFLITVVSFLPEAVLGTIIAPLPRVRKNMLYPGSPNAVPIMKPLLAVSIQRRTGGLLLLNDTWNLQPAPALRERIVLVHCEADSLTSFAETDLHATRYHLKMIRVSSPYHQYFDAHILGALFKG